MTAKSTSPRSEAKERSAGFVLFHGERDCRRYLLLRHRVGGHWAFPKGRIEPVEDAEDAARREVQEETGIERMWLVPGFRSESRYRFRRGEASVTKSVVYFLAEAAETDVRLSDEHDNCAWLDPSAARERLTFGEARRVLDDAERALRGSEPLAVEREA